MDPSQYSAPVSRVAAIAAGLVVTVLGVGLLALFGLGLYRLLDGTPDSSTLIILAIIGIIGVGLCVVGLRLLTGKRRRDGGLFSPWALRVAGALFIVAPVIFLFVHRTLFTLLESGLSISAGIACFVIANRREQHEA